MQPLVQALLCARGARARDPPRSDALRPRRAHSRTHTAGPRALADYKWVEGAFERTNARTGEPGFSEILPIKHYYHRYTRSIFWELNDLIPFGNNPLYRYCFGWLGAPKVAFLKLFMTRAIRESVVTKHVVQDIIVPIDAMRDGLELFHEQFDLYPLLVFPIRVYDHGDAQQGFLRAPRKIDGVDGPDGQHPGKAWGM